MESGDERCIIWFDIDNTLYSSSTEISRAMEERIHIYFVSLGLPEETATQLHKKYYTEYGLAIRGLVRHHQIDPLEFDKRCDGSLPLEEMLRPDPSVRKLLEDIDRSKARVWGLTNAYQTHARRVLRVLNLEDQFEGIVYCDYAEQNFVCKPEEEFYHRALSIAKMTDPSKCYFIDDSAKNVRAAKRLGWRSCIHFHEQGLEAQRMRKRQDVDSNVDSNVAVASTNDLESVTTLEELRNLWPEIFKGA